MESRIYLINLYDIYSELLTDKQKNYFEDYYFDNLTLEEISENYKVSRNAVHKQIKETEKKLTYYEDTLKIHEKNKKIKEIIKEIDENKRIEIEKIL